MICPKCNATVDDNMRFCGICGEDMLAFLQSQQASSATEVKNEVPDEYANTGPAQQMYDNSWQYNNAGAPGYAPDYNGAQNQSYANNSFAAEAEDKPDTLMNILSFIVPIAGMILYFIEKDKHPIKARAMLKWTVAAYIASYAFAALMVIFCFGMMFFAMFMETALYW